MLAHALYFIRHGETDWNAACRIQGHTDIPLNATGRAQAARNGHTLAELIVDSAGVDFVASPLSRARETMRITRRKMGLPTDQFAHDAALKELNFGSLEGQPWIGHQILLAPERFRERDADPFQWRPQGGESYADLTGRVGRWLAAVSQPTVVVSHGGVMRALRGLVLGLEPRLIPALDVPQDRVLVLTRGAERWI